MSDDHWPGQEAPTTEMSRDDISGNWLKIWHAQGSNETLIEYGHKRSDYVARVRLARVEGLDGGVLIDTTYMLEGFPVVPKQALLDALEDL
jgi:hypothetical protein